MTIQNPFLCCEQSTRTRDRKWTRSFCHCIGILVVACSLFGPIHADVLIEKFGDPIWKPVGFAYGSAPITHAPADAADFFAMKDEWYSTVFGEEHVFTDDVFADVVLPGTPHDGPYDLEMRRGFAASGILQSDVVLASEFRGAKFFAMSHVLVPTEKAPLGRSPDGESTPVIPDEVFPMESKIGFYRQGKKVGAAVTSDGDPVLALSEMGLITDENGQQRDFGDAQWSHKIHAGSYGNKADVATSKLVGDWEKRIELRDANGDGWNVNYNWEVVSRASRIHGDLSHNGELDLHDLRILSQNVAVDAFNLKLDMNGDKAVDVADVHYWVTDLKGTWIGDANLDGEFNSADFVDVFEAGKFEINELARWHEGDWNADERFDSSDFVAAFADGGYEMGTRASVASVPEPNACLLLIIGGFVLTRARRHMLSCH